MAKYLLTNVWWDNTYNNVRHFDSAEAQAEYFGIPSAFEASKNYNFRYADTFTTSIVFRDEELSYKDLLQNNYLIVYDKEHGYSNDCLFFFITRMTHDSANQVIIDLELDVYQTFLTGYQVTFSDSLIRRGMADRWENPSYNTGIMFKRQDSTDNYNFTDEGVKASTRLVASYQADAIYKPKNSSERLEHDTEILEYMNNAINRIEVLYVDSGYEQLCPWAGTSGYPLVYFDSEGNNIEGRVANDYAIYLNKGYSITLYKLYGESLGGGYYQQHAVERGVYSGSSTINTSYGFDTPHAIDEESSSSSYVFSSNLTNFNPLLWLMSIDNSKIRYGTPDTSSSTLTEDDLGVDIYYNISGTNLNLYLRAAVGGGNDTPTYDEDYNANRGNHYNVRCQYPLYDDDEGYLATPQFVFQGQFNDGAFAMLMIFNNMNYSRWDDSISTSIKYGIDDGDGSSPIGYDKLFDKDDIVGRTRDLEKEPKIWTCMTEYQLRNNTIDTISYQTINLFNPDTSGDVSYKLQIIDNFVIDPSLHKEQTSVIYPIGFAVEEENQKVGGLVINEDRSIPVITTAYGQYIANNKNAWASTLINALIPGITLGGNASMMGQQSNHTMDTTSYSSTGSTLNELTWGLDDNWDNYDSTMTHTISSGVMRGKLGTGGLGVSLNIAGAIKSIVGQALTISNLKNAPSSVNNATNAYPLNLQDDNTGAPRLDVLQPLEKDMQVFADYLYFYGYKIDQIGNIADFEHVRYYFNFIQADVEQVSIKDSEGNIIGINDQIRAVIKAIYSHGVRIWEVDMPDFNTTLENYEVSLL